MLMFIKQLGQKPQLPYIIILLALLFSKSYFLPDLGRQRIEISFVAYFVMLVISFFVATLIRRKICSKTARLAGFIIIVLSLVISLYNTLVFIPLVTIGSLLLASEEESNGER